LALETLSKPGDGVLIQPPVYTPFFEVIEATGRQLLTSQLLETDSGWEIDFDDFEAKARNARIFILCSPHNPVGRVWRRSELEQLAAICLRHNVKIVSDEIHADFVYPGSKHTVTATLSDEVNAATVTCTAPSKTFNLAGLQLANVFAADAATRHGMAAAFHGQGLSHTPALGLLACQVAYSGACDEWVDALVRYLDTTMALIESEVAQRLAPSVAFHRPEGTYLTWLDLRKLGLTIPEARQLVVERAGLWLSEGSAFGPGGDGYWRLNAAFARATVRDALDRLAQALG
jgi:cystathionine beta-lyase